MEDKTIETTYKEDEFFKMHSKIVDEKTILKDHLYYKKENSDHTHTTYLFWKEIIGQKGTYLYKVPNSETKKFERKIKQQKWRQVVAPIIGVGYAGAVAAYSISEGISTPDIFWLGFGTGINGLFGWLMGAALDLDKYKTKDNKTHLIAHNEKSYDKNIIMHFYKNTALEEDNKVLGFDFS